MSFRNTFTTEFIYDGNPELIPAFESITTLSSRIDERGIGHFSGFFKTLSGTIEEVNFTEMIEIISKASRAKFRICFMLEGQPQGFSFWIEPKLT